MPALEFPGGTLLFDFTEFLLPAGDQTVLSTSLIDEKKVELSFDMSRNGPPTLLVTMNSL